MPRRKKHSPLEAIAGDISQYAEIAAVGLIGLAFGIPVGQYLQPIPDVPKPPKPYPPAVPEKAPADMENVIEAEWEDVT